MFSHFDKIRVWKEATPQRRIEMIRNLTRREWANVNQDIDFDDLAIGMEVTVDDTVDAGWYTVSDTRNWGSKNDYVKLEMIQLEEK